MMWKDIKGYEGLYLVSDLGEVKSMNKSLQIRPNCLITRKGKIMKSEIDNRGYCRILLFKDNKSKHYLVHRLVAQAFIPNPDNLPQVNHKDENKLNNNVDNLEWCDYKYNINYGTAILRRVAKKKKPVRLLSLDGELIKIWDSAVDALRELGICKGQICRCCKGQLKTSKGYKWEYDS